MTHQAIPTAEIGSTCRDCERATAEYSGRVQHRRGHGDGQGRRHRPVLDRLAELERHMQSLIAAEAALSVQIAGLATEIREWTSRQPIYVELRPRHQRLADGGEGGLRERKRLRSVGPA